MTIEELKILRFRFARQNYMIGLDLESTLTIRKKENNILKERGIRMKTKKTIAVQFFFSLPNRLSGWMFSSSNIKQQL
ncbi:MAG: hypothetical protein SCABRO_01646 [Candidatus Scalindua brodae]|uniref:Uncharacterized protein n=1 Tax=Candidatus Scalindua brodae TaxID=237368 RepID=A0A0B0ENB2_9BACT|nr:MAG: hypothetical protein SCABRO_01646 [Candidatus Scalindua brodae]